MATKLEPVNMIQSMFFTTSQTTDSFDLGTPLFFLSFGS